MGKKRNRRNKSNKNRQQNSLNENQSCPTSFHDVRENEDSKNDNTDALKTDVNSVNCEKIACTTDGTLRKENQKSSFTDIHGAKPKTLSPYEITETKFSSEPLERNSCCFNDDDDDYYVLSLHQEKVKAKHDIHSRMDKNKFTSSKYITHEHLGSDDEYSTSDFFRPIFKDLQGNKNKKTTDDNFGEADDIYNFRPLNADPSKAGSSDFASSVQNYDYGFNKLRGTMTSHVDIYKNSKDYFKEVFLTWLPKRKITIQKLKALYSEIHDVQLNYNKSQVALRELSYGSRSVKNTGSQAINFFASFTAFLSDAASGVVSAVQALNVESYQNKFQEIIDDDAEITQRLYKARSQCVAKYHNIEEVMKKFQFETFSSTIGKISNTLEVDKYWEAMKNAYQKDNMNQLLNVVGKFFDNATQSTKLEEISGSIQNYTDDNPAAKDACKFAGRATYGALDTVGINRSQNAAFRGIDFATNRLLMLQDQVEVDRLKCLVNDENYSQSKLEAQIEEAINSLELEIQEMNDIYEELFKFNFGSDNYGDDDCKNNFIALRQNLESKFIDSDDDDDYDHYDVSDYHHDNW